MMLQVIWGKETFALTHDFSLSIFMWITSPEMLDRTTLLSLLRFNSQCRLGYVLQWEPRKGILQILSGCGANSAPCGCRTTFPISLLVFRWIVLAPRGSLCSLCILQSSSTIGKQGYSSYFKDSNSNYIFKDSFNHSSYYICSESGD